MTRKALLLLVPLLGAAALLAFLLRTADTPPASGEIVVQATPEAATPAPMPMLAPPELIRVVLDGPHSTGRFRLADGSEHTIGLHETLQQGWPLTALDSGAATFATPGGLRRVALAAAPVVPAKEPAKTVLVPDAPAQAGDGQQVTRCTDPEC